MPSGVARRCCAVNPDSMLMCAWLCTAYMYVNDILNVTSACTAYSKAGMQQSVW